MAQHFHGQLSGLIIEQKEELQRSSECIRDCHQYLDISDVKTDSNIVSSSQIFKSKKKTYSICFFLYHRNLLVILIVLCGCYVQIQKNLMKIY